MQFYCRLFRCQRIVGYASGTADVASPNPTGSSTKVCCSGCACAVCPFPVCDNLFLRLVAFLNDTVSPYENSDGNAYMMNVMLYIDIGYVMVITRHACAIMKLLFWKFSIYTENVARVYVVIPVRSYGNTTILISFVNMPIIYTNTLWRNHHYINMYGDIPLTYAHAELGTMSM